MLLRPNPLLALLLAVSCACYAESACILLGDPPVPGQFTLYGAAPYGALSGLPVAVGDFDGDGWLDLAATPMRANVLGLGAARYDAGLAYVAFGNGKIEGYMDFSTPPTDGLIVCGARAGDHLGDEVWEGDVNGDGIEDLLLCAQDADGPDGASRNRAGALYIVFGGDGLRGSKIDLLNPPAGVTVIHGEESGDRLGIWIRCEDVNADGMDDILVGADGADGPANSRNNSGEAYVLYGRESWNPVLDLAVEKNNNSLVLYGVDPSDRFGGTCGYGDFNGDGLLDVTVSAGYTRSGAALAGGPAGGGGDGPDNNRINSGECYLFFQPREGWPDVIDAANPPVSVSRTILYGENPNDFCGEELANADLDADGIDEWMIGAFPARNRAGKGYILKGGKHLENRAMDMLKPPDNIPLCVILGALSPDIATDTMIAADLNGDSFQDLLVGSPMASYNGRPNFGRLDIFFGRGSFLPAVIDLASPPAELGHVCVVAPEEEDILAYSIAVGDWDKDGFDDIMPNGMNGDGWNDNYAVAGDAYVVSGQWISSHYSSTTPTPTATITPTPLPSATPTPTRSADLDASGKVDARDLLLLIMQWQDE